MPQRARSLLRYPVLGPVSAELVSAKESLRERLIGRVEVGVARVLALRKAREFEPSPGVNLVGIGVGEKVSAGKRTGEMCVKLFVARKFPKGRISFADRLPATIDGIPTDVEGVGYARKFEIPQRQRQRPVPGGVSVGLDFQAVPQAFAGTLGVIVARRDNPRTLAALSNNHVLADENRAPVGAGVVQPGTLDGGRNADRVARLSRYVPLRFNNQRNTMDAAIGEFERGIGVAQAILGIGAPTGAADPALNLVVRKSGRTTGVTEGIVRAVRFDAFNIQYDQGLVRVDDIIVIEGAGGFSRAGDSGSAIIDPQRRVVALLFAGSDVVTFAIPIRRILRRLEVRIAT